jgi:hypothetical protein
MVRILPHGPEEYCDVKYFSVFFLPEVRNSGIPGSLNSELLFYSWRRAAIGSILVARLAGI